MSLFDEFYQNATCGTIINLDLCDPQPNTTIYQTLYLPLLDLYERITQYTSYPTDDSLLANALQVVMNRTQAANTTGSILRAINQVPKWPPADLSHFAK